MPLEEDTYDFYENIMSDSIKFSFMCMCATE